MHAITKTIAFSADPDLAEQQMNAVIFYLTAFGYIDGAFDFTEKTFVREYIRRLVEHRALAQLPEASELVRQELTEKFAAHFLEIFEETDRYVRTLFAEATSEGEAISQFVYAKLELRCYEIFRSFDKASRELLLHAIEELVHTDGHVHPAEEKFRAELTALLDSQVPSEALAPLAAEPAQVTSVTERLARLDNHPFFIGFEEHYSADPERLRMQAARDLALVKRFVGALRAHKQRGQGRLGTATQLREFAAQAPFLDGHIWVHPAQPGRRYELTVLGDMHGCYSCLKGALLQSDFLAKLEAWKLDPSLPEPKLIFLGDYIDRGRFSFNGVFRAVMELYLLAPDHVFPLRGNHEYFVEYKGRIYGGVRPAEAIASLWGHMPDVMFAEYRELFEEMPTVLFFDDVMFVHAGLPREALLRERYRNLASLNDEELRFQMLWSDPSIADHIPDALQAQSARFPFGRLQFAAFMERIGARMMVRGHEKIDAGFCSLYPAGTPPLLNLFSAGGADNNDLPEDSSYRAVTPMALSLHLGGGPAEVLPWKIDYRRFNEPGRNRFFAKPAELPHKAE